MKVRDGEAEKEGVRGTMRANAHAHTASRSLLLEMRRTAAAATAAMPFTIITFQEQLMQLFFLLIFLFDNK